MAFYGYLEISIPTLLQQVSPHTHRRVRDGVRAHQALRVPLESAPRVHGTACAHPLLHFCTAGRIFSVPWPSARSVPMCQGAPRAEYVASCSGQRRYEYVLGELRAEW